MFNKDFLEVVFFSGATEDEILITQDAKDLLNSEGMVCIEYSNDHIPGGPYLIVGDRFWETCRLYEDSNDAFVVTLHPQQSKYEVRLVFAA